MYLQTDGLIEYSEQRKSEKNFSAAITKHWVRSGKNMTYALQSVINHLGVENGFQHLTSTHLWGQAVRSKKMSSTEDQSALAAQNLGIVQNNMLRNKYC